MTHKYYEKHNKAGHGSFCSAKKAVACLSGLMILCSPSISAQSVNDSTTIRFHQSKSNLDLGLGNNRENLDRMLSHMREYSNPDSSLLLKRVKVVGSASPEGSVEFNRELSERRAQTIFDWFNDRVPLASDGQQFDFTGRNWSGLYSLVERDTRVPYRQEVLRLLETAKDNASITPEASNQLLAELKSLRGGQPYEYLYNSVFPLLRDSQLFVSYERVPTRLSFNVPPLFPDTEAVGLFEVPEIAVDFAPVKTCKPFYMALKTNLLYDALAVPSIGAEFYLGKNWSIAGNWEYGWWDTDRTHRYWRAYGGDLAVRKWFGSAADKKPLTGHHLGLYAGVFTYDFEFGGVGHMGGRPGHSLWDRCMYTAGVEYGYSLPIARRLNLDFTLGVGYVGGKVVKYHPKDKFYVWESTKRINTVLPTKLEVSLVWLIGCDNVNRK